MTKKGRHPTLIEVAKKAGVGATTVSRAINGGHRVDPKTLARIQRAIDSLGYMPNQAARTLKGDRTRIVGFVIPSIADPFFSSCAEAAQGVARTHDTLLIVLTTQNNTEAELQAVRMLMRHRADGFIISPAVSDSAVLCELLRRVPVPVVALDRPVLQAPISSVVADNRRGAQAATEHLIEHGYRRIVCLTGETGLYTIQERMCGYQEAMQAAGLQSVIDESITDHASTERAVGRLFAGRKPPEAIFTLKNKITIETFGALQKRNLAVPGDVALLVYDDFELADTLRPSVGVVQQPVEEIGRRAAELLFEQLAKAAGTDASAGSLAPVHLQLRTQIVRRRSCGC